MPTDVGRALSIQQQYALELIATQAAAMSAALLLSVSQSVSRQEADALASQYETLLAGAMIAVASTRVGYLQAFAQAEGVDPFDVPARVLAPTVRDVLVGGDSPLPEVRGVGSTVLPLRQEALRAPSQSGAMWAALTDLKRNLDAGVPDAMARAQALIADTTESTAMSTADWADAMVIGPSRWAVALRRVIHPGACERCVRVAGVLVFKSAPRLRHPQCRCSFEPVFADDGDYQVRLAKYQRNANQIAPTSGGGAAWARDTRYRGRQQLERAQFRQESEWLQEGWTDLLRDEQARLAALVKAIPSNTYRNWAVMVAAKQTEIGGDLLPVITRE